MAKKYRKHRKGQPKWLTPVFIALVVALIALLVANALLPKSQPTDTSGWVLTEEGHIHDAEGNHISTYEEMFGQPWPGLGTPTDVSATPSDLPADAPAAE
ncbi:MAG: hypothetical protein IKK21_08160 [Clostridia bacterium]|nr:hypothetical protein [Clostridia bacterium]